MAKLRWLEIDCKYKWLKNNEMYKLYPQWGQIEPLIHEDNPHIDLSTKDTEDTKSSNNEGHETLRTRNQVPRKDTKLGFANYAVMSVILLLPLDLFRINTKLLLEVTGEELGVGKATLIRHLRDEKLRVMLEHLTAMLQTDGADKGGGGLASDEL